MIRGPGSELYGMINQVQSQELQLVELPDFWPMPDPSLLTRGCSPAGLARNEQGRKVEVYRSA